MVGLLITSLVVALSSSPSPQQGPPPTVAIAVAPAGDTQELTLKDGTRAIGRVETIEAGRFTFRTTSGAVMSVETDKVQSLGTVSGRVVAGDFWPDDSNPTRLFFAPTGRALKRGESYLGVYEIMLPFVQYGITDRISVGAGTPLIFGSGGDTPFWVTPKVQVLKAKSTEAALGVIHFINVGDANLGIAYGVVTQGSADSAITVGAGYAYVRDEGSDDGSAVVMFGGEHRVSRRLKLVTENYAFDGGGILSGGVRFLGERLSVDLGLASPLGVDVFVAFPVINFVWKF
ncbi:MAG: hypothetical protein A3J29_09315 [Acidobacteria bacterium RIFCSPLOWO2_12_FULL_67_14b]|nr:MAG: hypothetical protein A3J29_09315 [Acidobacteria bacterium RIFCSPLOWO2_12_FULL_67_14b]